MKEMSFDAYIRKNSSMLRAITHGETFDYNLQSLFHRFETPDPLK